MKNVFEVVDKSGRKIRLTEKQWSHMIKTHGELSDYIEEIRRTLENPLKIISQERGKFE